MTDKTSIQKADSQRMFLAISLVSAFVVCIIILFFRKIPPENKDLITYMIGQLSGMATMAMGYYFVNKVGQDAADDKKSENTGKMADAIVAAAQAGGTPADLKQAASVAAEKVADAAVVAADKITDTAQARAADQEGDVAQ